MVVSIIRSDNHDEFGFYVSSDGAEVGMSVRGLAKLCGVSPTSLSDATRSGGKLLDKLALEEPITSAMPECLKPFQGKVWIPITNSQFSSDRIVDADVCFAVIEYYALESKAANDTAKESLRRSGRKGIRSFIKELVGFSEANKLAEMHQSLTELVGMTGMLLQQLNDLKQETSELKQETRQFRTLKQELEVNDMEGLQSLLEDYSYPQPLLTPGSELFTLKQWLTEKGVSLDKSRFHRFANLVAQTYRTLTKREPMFAYQPRKDGKHATKAMVFALNEDPILRVALEKLIGNKEKKN